MGASWSNKSSWFGSNSPTKDGKVSSPNGQYLKQPKLDPRRLASQFVYTRKGSMYFDEDGDLAHEFYEEIKVDDSQKTTMRQKLANLRPQGTVYYPNPRLHVDFPIPMYSPIEK
ncbi:hypothetical protein DAPPUDRAFT_311882 [Daphnia pulex]|uniref:Tumor suppressor candidate 2 n=1 Tax=Daphnia pulex TaxID=6669 RepID=E9FY73_DAPPU|nr:tumor suppressor candidate 2-like [Daphnia pulicaria]EFX87828.1 hypothetical protein DAPPUDRAFT_311882 [Daphnia pulex]|eukprot:EFX87828.1 hypothetical protein DAPPUDRAFT_311882 [Daphnia pulex]